MKKIGIFIALALAGALAFAAVKWYSNGKEDKPNTEIKTVEQKRETVQSIQDNWKTYVNDELDFTFQYPGSWAKASEDVKVIDRTGAITAMHINFTDISSQTTLLIKYHLAPAGGVLYKEKSSQYNSSQGWYEIGAKEIEVAGTKAIVATRTLSTDGKGNTLTPSLKSTIVDFLDKKQTGEVELQFLTPATNEDVEVAKFNQLLSSFKFTN